MLNTPAEYPASGAEAFLAPTGEAVRIQRRNDDGTALISRQEVQPGIASGNVTVALVRLHATQMAAINATGRSAGQRRARAK